ncbi:hypothetical protein GGI43DRAFT_382131 [Trichoderma evansii]
MREEKQGRGCNYENDLEIAMFKYRASVRRDNDMGPAEGQKRQQGQKIGDQGGSCHGPSSEQASWWKVFLAMERVPPSRSYKSLVTHPRLQRYLIPPPAAPSFDVRVPPAAKF